MLKKSLKGKNNDKSNLTILEITILPKGVINATLKTANKNQELYTLKKKHFFALSDNFLFYFKSKEVNRFRERQKLKYFRKTKINQKE